MREAKEKLMHLCHFATPPTEGRECLEAVWSQGRSCRTCNVDCYRRGWDKYVVDADNKRLVATTLRKLPTSKPSDSASNEGTSQVNK